MKATICTVVGIVGSFVAWLFGGWDASIRALLLFMAVDYATGLILAGVFRKSPKTKSGGLQSKIGWERDCSQRRNIAVGADFRTTGSDP